MLKQLYELASKLFSLTRDTQDNRAQIKVLQRDLETLTTVVRQLTFELRRVDENQTHEREKLVLRMENTMLRSKLALPSGRNSGEKNESDSDLQASADRR